MKFTSIYKSFLTIIFYIFTIFNKLTDSPQTHLIFLVY